MTDGVILTCTHHLKIEIIGFYRLEVSRRKINKLLPNPAIQIVHCITFELREGGCKCKQTAAKHATTDDTVTASEDTLTRPLKETNDGIEPITITVTGISEAIE